MLIALHDRGYGWFDAERRVGPGRWEWFDLLWIYRGAISVSFMEQEPVGIVGGQGVLIYPDTPFVGHATTAKAYASVLHFELRDRRGLLEPIRRIADLSGGYMLLAHDDIDADIARAHELADAIDDPLGHDMFAAQLAIVLGRLLRFDPANPPTPRMRAIDKLIDWLGNHLAEPISLEQMAERVDMSPSHFRACFREQIGDAPGRYLQQRRMNEAARLLRSTSEPIKQIAMQVGYPELANFYRAFRAAHGMTPAAYRQRHALRG